MRRITGELMRQKWAHYTRLGKAKSPEASGFWNEAAMRQPKADGVVERGETPCFIRFNPLF
jgi:hypothetical protein